VAKKYTKSYQPKDPISGEPVGPPQVFEADTLEELVDKVTAAHENASVALYEARKAAKLETLLDFDPQTPVRKFVPRQVPADERVKIQNMLGNPATAQEGYRILMENEFGAPLSEVRKYMEKAEIDQRIAEIQRETDSFLAAHLEYHDSETNQEKILAYLQKNNYAVTKKNLEIAYKDLMNHGLLAVKPSEIVQEIPVASTPAETIPPAELVAATPVSPVEPAIPAQPEAVVESSKVLRPAKSTSGLPRGSAAPPPKKLAEVKTQVVTAQYIASLSADQLLKAMQNKDFAEAVDKLNLM